MEAWENEVLTEEERWSGREEHMGGGENREGHGQSAVLNAVERFNGMTRGVRLFNCPQLFL